MPTSIYNYLLSVSDPISSEKYLNLYNRIIAHNRIISPVGYKHNNKISGYKEKHHIIPECMGGSNSIKNFVYLTARSHFIVHRILTKIYPNNSKIWYAFHMMFTNKGNNNRLSDVGWLKSTSSSKVYEYCKLKSAEFRKSIRVGMKHSEETLIKMRNIKLGKIASEETRQKISIASTGRIMPKESIDRSAHKRSYIWCITTPNSETIVVKNLKKYCRENDIDQSAMYSLSKGKYCNKDNFKGYKIYLLSKDKLLAQDCITGIV